jgi:hypothetical protein
MYRLRQMIGILGLMLPILLIVFNKEDEIWSSMSHYYYSTSGVFFIGILISFGLVLLYYQGYPLDPSRKELMSDNLITTIAAISIFITVLVPTAWNDISTGENVFKEDYLFGHQDIWRGAVHLSSAGSFLICLGYMSYFKITMGENIPAKRKKFYRISGTTVWVCVALLICCFTIDIATKQSFKNGMITYYFKQYVFFFELIAVWAFAIAWLVKGKINKVIPRKGDIKAT